MSNEIVCSIRCPIHGFIELNAWEKVLVESPVFQRLRRIRQLAWTDFVYPGAMHTRFEHSLGVMHVATLLFDSIVKNSKSVLTNDYGYDEHGLAAARQKIRIAALLHDVGHPPFSHASEEVFPLLGTHGENRELPFKDLKERRYRHEDYSYALIENQLRDSIEQHSANKNYEFEAKDISNLLKGHPDAGHSLLWRDILDNQLDADRMDYLLRDSHHLGVNYGKYDLHRLVASVCAFRTSGKDDKIGRVHIGVNQGGLHAAESLIIARYSMFKQVYFHKTRMAFDIHLRHVMSELLPNGCFPTPDEEGLNEYLRWDDWRVLGLLADEKGGSHAKRMLGREQYRQVYRSKDRLHSLSDALRGEKRKTEALLEILTRAGIDAEMKTTKNSWYKALDGSAITVVDESNPEKLAPLSEYSPIASLNAGEQDFLYVRKEDVQKARSLIDEGIPRIEELLRAEVARLEGQPPAQGAASKKAVSAENEPSQQSRTHELRKEADSAG